MNSSRLAVFVISAIMLLSMLPNQGLIAQVHAQTAPQRNVSIPVKVILVGVDPATVNLDYIKWGGNLPTTTFGEVLEPPPGGSLTGVVYNVSYTFSFASEQFKSNLESYLQSIQVVKEERNPYFYNYTLESNGYVNTNNFYSFKSVSYDANRVESWLYNHQNDLGGFPSNGWTLMLMNLPELPSYSFKDYRNFLINQRTLPPTGTAHYYSVNYKDLDLGYQLRYRDYMTGWGGIHRFWYNDLSAGPSFWTWPEDLPLQVALADNHLDINTAYGKTWFTQYIGDYISQATWNFVVPFFEYTPVYSQRYSFDIHVFDNRTDQEKQAVNINSTVDPAKIKSAFQDLIPYSQIQVSLKFEDLTQYPDLEHVIQSSYMYSDSFTYGVSAQPLRYHIVDARPVYKFLEDNMQTFEPDYRQDNTLYVIPVFAFAFSNDTLFTFTYKWSIAKEESQIKALLGVALGDLALVSLSQQEFQRGNYITPPQPNLGEAFTEVIIHESGHMVGLPHPHNFGPVGDFIQSVMGYYTYDYTFGQSDKDMLRRAHVDQIYLNVESLISKLDSQNSASAIGIKNELNGVDEKYSQMDYVSALSLILQAQQDVNSALGSPLSDLVAPLLYVVVGLVIGLLVSWLAFRRRTRPTDHTWTPSVVAPQSMIKHAFCTNCGRASNPTDLYCHYCGTRVTA